MKKALCNCFKEIFYRLLFYGMNCNPHWNKNFEAASPQASDCTSQFVTWFNLVNILWKNHEPYWERPPGRRGEAASCFNIASKIRFSISSKINEYRSGCKNASIFSKISEMQSMHPKLSKTDPGMSLRCLNVFLCSFEFTFKTINCAILSKKLHFGVLTTRAAWIIKIDPKVVGTFWDRF